MSLVVSVGGRTVLVVVMVVVVMVDGWQMVDGGWWGEREKPRTGNCYIQVLHSMYESMQTLTTMNK